MKIKFSLIFFICFLIKNIYSREQTTHGLHIKGNTIYNSDDEIIMLRGVNRPGTEYMCVQNAQVFDGPCDSEHIELLRSWKLNAIRVPLNEDCWLGNHGNEALWYGNGYRDTIKSYVEMLCDHNLAVILDLHWSSKNGLQAKAQIPMPNNISSVDFWKSVARDFKDNSRVIFDLYNEPYPNDNAYNDDDAWQCWKDGTQCTNQDYGTVGMQQLLEAVRSTGATNIILMSGIQYASSFLKFFDYMPRDTLSPQQIAASLHAYEFNQCKSKGCWDIEIKPIFDQIPMIATETGQKDCQHDFLKDFLQYCDDNGVHYLAWSWLVGDCNVPSLIENYEGDPTTFGQGYKNHLERLAKNNGRPLQFSDTFDIYNDKITHWADDWSTSKPVINSSEVIPCEGKFSIKFNPIKEKSLHFMCYGCIQTNVHKQLEFWIHGGEMGSQDLNLQILHKKPDHTNEVKQTYSVEQLNGKPIAANTWTKIIVPFDDSDEVFDGFWLKANEDQPTVYVDKITVRARKEPADNDNNTSKLIFNLFTIILISILSVLII
ncbi:hypothetical protein DDB_G0286061 [Dictyostelium discoideum AX4]|uniref:Glycoside hydrolase family 5 domain-containing protein n=1 Tax=Dictyostelium discoideum TaxID=44689 RepID=Q54MB3_DICDI|nr:hypothetical protein DDB_G0286061 [Dictyostelium discoideum AX4]EAL64409.1 hypothetical protein DDB_G0286061 [Dictyostelium discoideum AX4]|eukprot:XP_637921.1 hypothetical protein DDB_G0286061 [Dictyostelium discoideum AX4]